MTNLAILSTVLILGAGMCQSKQPEAAPVTPDSGAAQAAPSTERPYVDQKNEDLRDLKQGLQQVHDEHGQQLEHKSKAGEP